MRCIQKVCRSLHVFHSVMVETLCFKCFKLLMQISQLVFGSFVVLLGIQVSFPVTPSISFEMFLQLDGSPPAISQVSLLT